jgi:4-hydroxybenzoate polyprenyltransferase
VVALGLTVLAVGLTSLLPLQSAVTLAVYAAVSLTYSFQLKRLAILDVLCLGFLFTVRLAVGAALLENNAPYWLYAFSMFFFTSLAFVKRYTELASTNGESMKIPGRGYQAEDLPLVLSAGLGAALCSIVVFLIYLGDRQFDEQIFKNPVWLGLSVAALAYWLLRTWLLALRGQMHDDPVVFALKDRASYGLGLVVGLSLLLAW